MLADRHTRAALNRLYLSAGGWTTSPAAGEKHHAARDARQRVLDNLPTYLTQLEAHAQANGVHVYWADGAQAANRIIVERLREEGRSAALRNHSPLLDEIALDRAAAANNVRLVHMHPGDALVRLADSKPGHPIRPAAHLRLEAISAAMEQHWRLPRAFDADILYGSTRRRLRSQFEGIRSAIVGLNFAVAESGSVVMLDNDGHNATLVTLCDHLICLLSIEHVVADAADLHHLIEAFSQAAWGRPLPASITQISQPRRHDTSDGPGRIDLILVDNGRSRALAQGWGEALRCINCGACHAACPVYRQIGGQGYDDLPFVGPIGSVLNPIVLRPGLAEHQAFLSSGCTACHAACPVDIDLPALLERQRFNVAPAASFRERAAFWLWQRLLTRPRLFTRAMRLAQRFRS